MKKIAACADSTRTCGVFGPEPQLLADPARANPAFPLPPERAARPLAWLTISIWRARAKMSAAARKQAAFAAFLRVLRMRSLPSVAFRHE